MQYGTSATSDRWAIALGTGRGGWSVVKTAPLELLAEPGSSGEHRLGILARVLRCEALHVSLYDGTAMVIAEAAPTGEVVLSGYTMDGPTFHGVEIDEERLRPRIESSEVPRSVHTALERFLSDGFDELLEQLADRRWADVSLALIEGREVPSARVLSFTSLCFAGDVLGVRAERDEEPVIVTLDGGKPKKRPGDFRQWAREAMRVPLAVDNLYSTYELPMLWAGPDAVVAVEERARQPSCYARSIDVRSTPGVSRKELWNGCQERVLVG